MPAIDIIAFLDSFSISTTMALALVALIGYVFGQRTRGSSKHNMDAEQALRELRRAEKVARELENIAETVRKNLAIHHSSISQFRERISDLSDVKSEEAWRELCKEAEGMLQPTLRLATEISCAYDQIRQQSTQLMAFTEVRIDPLTGLNNRRGLDDSLEYMIAMLNRYDREFSMVIFDIDHFKRINDDRGHLFGDRTLKLVSRLLDETARETDIVARFGGEEFVILMPHTNLEGACIFGERCREHVEQEASITVSGGVAVAISGDTPQTLLSRVDSALYSAKAAGRNVVFRHDGVEIEPAQVETAAVTMS